MIEATCHCGAVRIEVPFVPAQLTSCNCSICRRLGGLMAYYDPGEVTIDALPAATVPYIWGDRTIALHHCGTCGCMTHWLRIDPTQQQRMGVNARMLDPQLIAGATIRRFDGADTWTFLD